MNVVGLDLSLTATGVAREDGAEVIHFAIVKDASDLDRTVRLRDLGILIDRATRSADLVVIEGHSFNSKNTHAHSLGELHGVVKVCLYQRGRPFVLIPPAKLKKFATDNGGAAKELVTACAIRDGFDGHDHNAADAWWLRRMGVYRYRPDLFAALPKYRQHVLDGIRWPSIESKEAAVG